MAASSRWANMHCCPPTHQAKVPTIGTSDRKVRVCMRDSATSASLAVPPGPRDVSSVLPDLRSM